MKRLLLCLVALSIATAVQPAEAGTASATMPAARLLTPADVLAAVSAALPSNERGAIDDRSIHVPAIWVHSAAPVLRVVRSHINHSCGCTEFVVRAESEQRLLPFYVVVDGERSATTMPASLPAAATKVNMPPDVIAGRSVTLMLQVGSARITLAVVALQSGRIGQRIRVRNVEHKNVIQAEVVGVNLVAANSQL